MTRKVLPSGVFVRIGDIDGYIRRRELTLSGNINPATVVIVGQTLQAVVLKPPSPGKLALLSVKGALPDPWPSFIKQHGVGDPVTVTVKALYPNAVGVEVVPGIDGYIPLSELTIDRHAAKPEDVLWEEDRTEAVITRIDHARKRLHLSIRSWLERTARAETYLEALRGDSTPPQSSIPSSDEDDIDLGRVVLAGPIMVVEDHDSLRFPLQERLSTIGCDVCVASCAEEALALCQQHRFAYALVDLDLPDMPGLDLIRQLRAHDHDLPIAVMSGPDVIQAQWPQLRNLAVVAAFPKPLDEQSIHHTLLQLAAGEIVHLPEPTDDQPTSSPILHFQDTVARINLATTLTGKMQQGLERLVSDLRADLGVIFHLDPTSKTLSIVAQSGGLHLDPQACYKLKESPVKDVIAEQRRVWQGRASSDTSGRYRNLSAVLEFESCIGVPLEASGTTQHALFLFSRQPDAFSPFRLRDVLAVAILLSAALEHFTFEEKLQAAGRVIISGHLASAFGHEVYNKVSGIGLHIGNLTRDLAAVVASEAQEIERETLVPIQVALAQAVSFIAELKRVVEQHQRMMRNSSEQTADVSLALQAAQDQVRPLALRSGVQVSTSELPVALPPAKGSPILMQQVFLNLMLNAVQQMAVCRSTRRSLEISANLLETVASPQIEVRFVDTGPGIHVHLWDKVFELGYTTRDDGSGLGLYIARSVVQRFGGTITIEDSLIQFGTTFLVQLPVAQ